MNLAQTQAAFQRFLLRQDGAIELSIEDGGRLSAGARLAIYGFAYSARLVGALAESFPAVRSTMGESQFAEAAHAFVRTHPSQFASIRWYGAQFPEFLGDRVPGPQGVLLTDLARWEWTLGQALDGPDAASLDDSSLASIPPLDWGRVRLHLLPSLRRVGLHSNALAYWRAAIHGDDIPTKCLSEPAVEWVAWRLGLATSFRSLATDEATCLDAALAGRDFGSMCEQLEDSVGAEAAPLRAATLLKTWLAEGWVTRVDLD